ncbi:hypothetical protein WCLP8_410012 [uncultured Gammaproteobacteria bacterium]
MSAPSSIHRYSAMHHGSERSYQGLRYPMLRPKQIIFQAQLVLDE